MQVEKPIQSYFPCAKLLASGCLLEKGWPSFHVLEQVQKIYENLNDWKFFGENLNAGTICFFG